jgi:pyruvate,water dikinase
MDHIVWFERYSHADRCEVGGKNASLCELTCAGLPVPPGFGITAAAYAQARDAAGLTGELAGLIEAADPARQQTVIVAGRKARDLVTSMPLPGHLEGEVRAAYAALSSRCGQTDIPVAVRSSATSEDMPDASFAGEHDSYLWVRGADAVLSHVRRCWASLFTDRAICYRRHQGYPETGLAMSVVVQKMVRPRAAGVAFTLNPQDGDRSQVAIDASWGFGEAVVSGEVNPDNFLVDKVIGEVGRRTVSHKEIEYRLTDGDRVERAAVEEARQDIPCLTDAEIKAVAALARRAERHYGCPQDVEWAVEAYRTAPAKGLAQDTSPARPQAPETGMPGTVLLLQSRPETVWSRKPSRPASAPGGNYMNSIVSTLVAPLHARPRAAGDR